MRHEKQQKTEYGRAPGKSRAPVLLGLLVLVVIVSLIAGGAAAKYVTSSQKEGYVVAKEFYFNSNLLTETGAEIPLNEGTTAFSFTVYNFADKLRTAEVDIKYTVTVTGGSATAAFAEGSDGILQANIKQDTETVRVSNLQDGETYTVTVSTDTTDGGYAKTLTGTFTVRKQQTGVYQSLQDGDGYLILTVWNEDYDTPATVDIVYADGLIPDNTNINMESWKTGNGEAGVSVTIAPDTSKVFRFFGDGAATAKMNGTEVTKADPW